MATKLKKSGGARCGFVSGSFGPNRHISSSVHMSLRRISVATVSGHESAFMRMEKALLGDSAIIRKKLKSPSLGTTSPKKRLDLFRKVANSVIILLRCFRMRRRFAVQTTSMTLVHREQTDDFEVFKTSSINRELRMILSTPPEHRTREDIRKVQFYLRATGASRLLASASTPEDHDNLARHIAYERYENDRVVAQQGRTPDRFYFVLTGKLLIVKEYHIDTGVISKTVGALTKGMTTSVEEMEQRTLRKASLICRGPVETLVLDCNDYFLVHGERGGAPREFLSRHSLFRSFPFHELNCHEHLVRLQYFPKDAVVFGGASEFEWIYIVKSGECSLVRMQTVADLNRHDNPLFNKSTAEQIGCQRIIRVKSAAEKRADFRMWKSPSKLRHKTLSERSHILPSLRMNQGQGTNTTLVKEAVLHNDPANVGWSEQRSERAKSDGVATDDSSGSTNQHIQTQPVSNGRQAYSEPNIPRRMHLTKSRLVAFNSQKQLSNNEGRTKAAISRWAYLELGKLKAGDVLGLEDSIVQIEDLPHVRLISDTGSEVVLLNRKFFLRNAPSSLLSEISYQIPGYPDIKEARSDHETMEAWNMYKTSLMKVLSFRGEKQERHRLTRSASSITSTANFYKPAALSRGSAIAVPRYIPPGTANRSTGRSQSRPHTIRKASPRFTRADALNLQT